MEITTANNQFALDVQGLESLKRSARQEDSRPALVEAVKQFEALFLQSMLKSMRDAMPKSQLLGGESQTQFYESLMDQQWAQHLSGKGIGLADQLLASLESQKQTALKMSETAGRLADIPHLKPRDIAAYAVPVDGFAHPENSIMESATKAPMDTFVNLESSSGTGHHVSHQVSENDFFARLKPSALAAAEQTGIPSELMLAQAALETGWGRYQIPKEDGGNSYNLFGIKAGAGWGGATTTITTHEVINGQKIPVEDKFRVYGSYEEAFADYAQLIGNSERYRPVVRASSAEQAAYALQQGGYATDPDYANKLILLIRQIRYPHG